MKKIIAFLMRKICYFWKLITKREITMWFKGTVLDYGTFRDMYVGIEYDVNADLTTEEVKIIGKTVVYGSVTTHEGNIVDDVEKKYENKNSIYKTDDWKPCDEKEFNKYQSGDKITK